MKITKSEVAETLAYLRGIYTGMIPAGQTEAMVHSWLTTLGKMDVERGELLSAAIEWARGDEHEFVPRPGQLMAIIRDEQDRRERKRKYDKWQSNGGLICTNGVYVNRDGETVDEHGNVIPEIGEGKPKDPDLDEIVQRITGRMKAK
jgi:hypothetical protein